MTDRDELRAFFAGCALIRGIGVDCHDQVDPAHCFTVADAMLAEHERRLEVSSDDTIGERNEHRCGRECITGCPEQTETQRLLGTRPWCHALVKVTWREHDGSVRAYCGRPLPCPDHEGAER